MTREETKTKIDALSVETKRWLRDSCESIADCGEYIPNDKARAECEAADLVDMRDDNEEGGIGEFMYVAPSVMSLVYSDGYLKDA